ncbi:MAG: DUF1836 domain-containing protein [Tyzzerella sp.]|nr:DUF1836 domain-containing protein [Tyzzerella sp.]
MTIDKDDLLNSILASISRIDYIKSEDIPNIDLYMDQVTSFMEKALKSTKRYPDDKILTKTMINNYAKNDLLPPPVKKKYSKEHLLVLNFIYYFKSLLSIGDIEKLLAPITEKYFQAEGNINTTHIYDEVCAFDKERATVLQDDIKSAFEASKNSFADASEEDKDLLQFFSFICMLSLDVYVKKLLIEKLIDTVAEDSSEENQKEKAKKKK